MNEIKQLICNVNLDVMCFVESWLHDAIPDASIKVAGFNVVRSDRKLDNNKRGGGICVFIKSTINYKLVLQHCHSNVEVLLIELLLEKTKVLLAVVYKPPKKKFFDDLKNIFTNYSMNYNDIIVCGDFNCDLNKVNNSNVKQLTSLFTKFSFKTINNEPTCFTQTSSSILDLIVTNTDKVVFLNQISVGFTDHDLIFFSYNIKYKAPNPVFTYRDFNHTDLSTLLVKCGLLNWKILYSIPNPCDKVGHLVNSIKHLFDECVPLKKVTVKEKHPAWFSNEIREMINFRNFIYRRWKHTKDLQLYMEYKIIRNKINKIVKLAKVRYYSTVLNPSLPSKIFWKNLKSINSLTTTNEPCPNIFSANDLNSHFASNSIDLTEPAVIDSVINPCNSLESRFSFINIDIIELNKAIDSIRSNAVGVDEIPIKFIKLIFPVIGCYILHVLNSLITFSIYPLEWKHSIIVAIPKKKSSTALSDFRPISLLPALSKVFERILQSQILKYIESKNLFSKFQSAYRRNHSTTSALLHISDDIRRAIDSGKMCSLVLLDFSKAFDTISHPILINKLQHCFKFSVSACRLIRSYLCERSQSVKINLEVSNTSFTNCGVPQGSVLGPFLFMLYINDLTNVIHNCSYHLFADDLQIYKFCNPRDISNCIEVVNSDINLITQWSSRNKLKINCSKTQSIILSSTNRCTLNLPKIKVAGMEISFSESVNNLGIIFDKTMSWNIQTEAVCRRVIFLLRMLWTTTKGFNVNLRLRIVKTYILPHFLYGDIVLFQLKQKYFYELQMIFNSCVRYIFGLRKFDHISDYSDSILGCSLEQMYEFRVCVHIFKFLKFNAPTYIIEKLILSPNRRNRLLTPALNRCRLMNSSFFVRGVSIWNSLSYQIKNAKTSDMFRKKYFENKINIT